MRLYHRPGSISFALALLLFACTALHSRSTQADGRNQPVLELIIGDLAEISNAVPAPDGSDRTYLLEQYTGRVRVLENGILSDEIFLDLGDRIHPPDNWEEGLLGFALPLNGEEAAYASYIDRQGDLVLSRFAVSDDGRRGIPTSEQVMYRVQRDQPMHQCGHIAFNPADGKLYLCVGDTQDNQEIAPVSQDQATFKGQILRFDPHTLQLAETPADGLLTAHAATAPTGTWPTGTWDAPETVAFGLRNPWRFTFDPVTGGLFIPDVGRYHSEELNFLPSVHDAPVNLGWPLAEGNECLAGCADRQDLVWPIFEYVHLPERCAIMGGATIGTAAGSEWRGVYVFGDLCSGELWAIRNAGPDAEVRLLTDSETTPVGLIRGHDGNLIVVDGPQGKLYRLNLAALDADGWRPARAVVAEAALETRRSGFRFTNELLEREREARFYMKESRRWRVTEPFVRLYDWLGRPFG